MSEVYNPEAVWLERLEQLELEASRLARLRDAAPLDERGIVNQQLTEVEQEIERVKTWLRSRT